MNSSDEERLVFTKNEANAARWGAISSNVLLPLYLAHLRGHYNEAEARALLCSFNGAVTTHGFAPVSWEEFVGENFSRR
ncbi:hypothetical protein HY032_02840 [Candidatus Gottesmanbacteria bacterium]|nr:hypothetical protein [Candidatus Gottesmanbacteria bacterium]